MKEKQRAGPYHISGYSFGACIAFEMCLQLELSNTAVGALSLLDGSHSYVAAHTGHYKARLTPGDTAREQSEVLCAFTLQFTTIDYIKVCFNFNRCSCNLPSYQINLSIEIMYMIQLRNLLN